MFLWGLCCPEANDSFVRDLTGPAGDGDVPKGERAVESPQAEGEQLGHWKQ